MRRIDADALTKALNIFGDKKHGNRHFLYGIKTALELIDDAPTIDAEPVRHGTWVMTIYTTISRRGRVVSNKKFACSDCGYNNGRKQTNYCPNCGLKMKGTTET